MDWHRSSWVSHRALLTLYHYLQAATGTGVHGYKLNEDQRQIALAKGLEASMNAVIMGCAVGGIQFVSGPTMAGPSSPNKMSDNFLKRNGISDIHTFKQEVLNTNKNLKAWNVYQDSTNGYLWLKNESTGAFTFAYCKIPK